MRAPLVRCCAGAGAAVAWDNAPFGRSAARKERKVAMAKRSLAELEAAAAAAGDASAAAAAVAGAPGATDADRVAAARAAEAADKAASDEREARAYQERRPAKRKKRSDSGTGAMCDSMFPLVGGRNACSLCVAGKRARTAPSADAASSATAAASARAACAEWMAPPPSRLFYGAVRAAGALAGAGDDTALMMEGVDVSQELGDGGFVAIVASLLAAGLVALVPVPPVRATWARAAPRQAGRAPLHARVRAGWPAASGFR